MLSVRIANSGLIDTSNIVNIRGDGNCFFRAVLVALQLKNISAFSMPEEQHLMLRELVVQHAGANCYDFSINNTEIVGGPRAWEQTMIRDGEFADNIAIEACSDFLEIPIEIISNGRTLIKFGERFFTRNWTTGIDNVIHLQLQYAHYSVIV